MKRALRFIALIVAAIVIGAATIMAGAVFNVAHAAGFRCTQPVGYMLNVPTLPGWENREIAIRDAVTMLSIATGQPYRFDGDTTWTPTTSTIDQAPDDLVIDVDIPLNTDLLLIDPYAAAYTMWTTTHAVVVLDAWNLESMPAGIDLQGGQTVLTLTEHELGHSVGLGHSTDPADIMNPTLTGNGAFYSAHDLDQLATTGCRP